MSGRFLLRSTQPSTLSGTENEYRPKWGDALRLGSKGRYGSFHLWINVRVAAKTVWSLVNTCIFERFRDELLMIKHYTDLRYFTYLLCCISMWCKRDRLLWVNKVPRNYQGSVVTCKEWWDLRLWLCYKFSAEFHGKEFWKLVCIWRSYWREYIGIFLTHNGQLCHPAVTWWCNC